ncbi:MAG: HlyD family efflux transporter periplasmic adaptor subunit [Haliscomenobacteraceae bacterium CHB4]|nr:hypothetical protein [Saprospiraceae bacterium]MCE7925322.1 HlyD family efflux transporter periplasmic adaptor subunit [Haliscomenobacteraceae bacterium CHB4]
MTFSYEPSDSTEYDDREQIQYLLGNPPSWMMRYGITVMASAFLLLLALSYFIHYPDVIEARVVLTTAHPPIRILANSGGRVTELLVADKQTVRQGQLLAVLENPAQWRDVMRLESWLDSTGGQKTSLPTGLHLGELQNAYSAFSQHWKDLDYFSRFNGIEERIGYLQKQITQLEAMYVNILKQKATMQEAFALAEKEYRRQQKLHLDKVIADREFEVSEAKYLEQKRQHQNAESVALQNQMQIRQLESQINDLRQGKSDNLNEKQLSLAEDLQLLRSAIAGWKQSFLITAPISGHVSFSKIWSAQQSVGAGEEVLAIVPVSNTAGDATGIVGKATLPLLNSGKIASGQRAVIRLDGYPAQQFGVLETTVANMSLLPKKDGQEEVYLLDLYLSDSLTTTYSKAIPFRQEMSGQVRIVTEDRRVIDRIFGSLRDLLQNR